MVLRARSTESLESAPDHKEAYNHWLAICRRTSPNRIVAVYRWALDNAPWASEDESRAALLRTLIDEMAQDESATRDAMVALGELTPNAPDVLTYFEARKSDGLDADAYFKVLERGLWQLLSPLARIERLEMLANVAEEDLSDPLLALDQLKSLLQISVISRATEKKVRARMHSLFEAVTDYRGLIELLEGEMLSERVAPRAL